MSAEPAALFSHTSSLVSPVLSCASTATSPPTASASSATPSSSHTATTTSATRVCATAALRMGLRLGLGRLPRELRRGHPPPQSQLLRVNSPRPASTRYLMPRIFALGCPTWNLFLHPRALRSFCVDQQPGELPYRLTLSSNSPTRRRSCCSLLPTDCSSPVPRCAFCRLPSRTR